MSDILKKIEFNCGLAYGTLSDPAQIALTATEITSSKQRFAAAVVDFQKALDTALEHLAYAIDIWVTLDGQVAQGTYEIVTEYDDSLVNDADAQFSHDSQVVTMGAMSKVKFLERNYGLPEKEAQNWVEEARAEAPDEEESFFGA